MFSFLYTMFEDLGINRYPNQVLGRNVSWDDVYNYLQGTPYKDLFWCPSSKCSGGGVGLNKKIISNWRDPEKVGQGILLGVVDEIPDGSFVIRKFFKDPYPIKCNVKPGQVSVIGDAGPYVLLAVCTANTNGPDDYATPIINRMILQSIKSWASWIPVETDTHRKIAALLFKEKKPFERVLFAKGLNLDIKPDFVVKNHCSVDLDGRHDSAVLEKYFRLPTVAGGLDRPGDAVEQIKGIVAGQPS
jgi:hypothetical protein